MYPQCPMCRSFEVERMNRMYEVYFKCRKCGYLFQRKA
jgi:ribosomal protein L37AE/L43A